MISVDIILPFYNGSRFIEAQLTSLQQNEYSGFSTRLIIINDSSSKEETLFLKNIIPAEAIYIENESNIGVIKTIEKGLKFSDADFIMLCDQDDWWFPDKIKKTIDFLLSLDSHKPGLIYTDAVIVDSELKVLHPSMMSFCGYDKRELKPSLIFTNVVTGCTTAFNRKLVDLALPFPDVPMHDHWLAVCSFFGGELKHLNQSTLLYRQHDTNQVGASRGKILKKILHFNKSVSAFNLQLKLKASMAKCLSERLRDEHEKKYLKKLADDLEDIRMLSLLRSEILPGSAFSKIVYVMLLSIIKISNFLKKNQNN